MRSLPISSADSYEIRYGWTRRGAWIALTLASFMGVGLIPGAEPPVGLLLEPLLAPILAATVLTASCRRTAVLIDQKGITLGRVPFTHREFVPWSEIVSVDLCSVMAGSGRFRVPVLDVRHRQGAAPQWHPANSPGVQAIDTYLANHVDADFVETFRGTTMSTRGMVLCRLDPARLKEAIQGFAPGVRVFGDVD